MKHRKIYYVPGMISLIFLPILCVWYLNKNYKPEERCLEVYFASKYIPHNSEIHHRFDTTVLSEQKNKRNYSEFIITGENSDKTKLSSIEKEVVHIVKENDTINGIHIVFGDNAKYESYINTLDILYKDSIWTRFIPFENNIWFLHFNNSIKEKNIWSNKTKKDKEYKKQYLINEELEYANRTFIEKYNYLLKFWPFFIIFILFSIISIRYITNNYKTN